MTILFLQDSGRAPQVGHLGIPQSLSDNCRGYTDAVKDVADIVQHSGGDFGHSSETRGAHELAIEFVEFFGVLFRAGHILENAAEGDGFSPLKNDGAALADP